MVVVVLMHRERLMLGMYHFTLYKHSNVQRFLYNIPESRNFILTIHSPFTLSFALHVMF
jgi:hypothetical protein